MRRPLLPVLVVAVLLLAACAPSEETASSYPDVAALSGALLSSGVECELEYEGLADGDREVSTCTIDGEFVLLQVWSDPDLLEQFLAGADPPAGGRISGGNWVIDVETSATAQRIVDALDPEP